MSCPICGKSQICPEHRYVVCCNTLQYSALGFPPRCEKCKQSLTFKPITGLPAGSDEVLLKGFQSHQKVQAETHRSRQSLSWQTKNPVERTEQVLGSGLARTFITKFEKEFLRFVHKACFFNRLRDYRNHETFVQLAVHLRPE